MMMAASSTTVVHVAGGAAASPLSGPSSASPPRASRLRGREPSDDGDDDAPLLPTSTRVASGGRASLRRCLRTRVVSWLLAVVSLVGGASWLAKGLCVCVGLVLVGGVGSFSLHQLMSPQIESLLRQRNEMLLEMEALRSQVANQTRIAETRLEMIHVLEQQLEKQVLAAAAAAAAASAPPLGGGGLAARPSPPFATPGRPTNFWTTLVYAAVLGSLVLALVGLRVYQIARAETQRTQKARASSDMEVRSVLSSGGLEDSRSEDTTGAKPSSSSSSSAYKRAPLGPSQDRLVHV